jgi:hypothetical protein
LPVGSFVPGRELAGTFYADVVAPLVSGVQHSAALLGWGSDVLGFDTERSTDHGWGPRLQVFVDEPDVGAVRDHVEAGLPDEFRGWPTRFGWDDEPVAHHVEVTTVETWFTERLGFDPRVGVGLRDWLTTPQQLLLEITHGALFHDGLGELASIRDALAWYPDDVWRWLLACQWRRIDQEEPFVGRAAEVGDELGSNVIATRLVRDVVRLCLLLERTYAPYSKWLGSGFRRLHAHAAIGGALLEAATATDYRTREAALHEAIRWVAARHNALGITRFVDEESVLFHDRPYRVLGSGRFADACLDAVSDPELRSLPPIGAVDQFVDSVDVLSNPWTARRTAAFFDACERRGA